MTSNLYKATLIPDNIPLYELEKKGGPRVVVKVIAKDIVEGTSKAEAIRKEQYSQLVFVSIKLAETDVSIGD